MGFQEIPTETKGHLYLAKYLVSIFIITTYLNAAVCLPTHVHYLAVLRSN